MEALVALGSNIEPGPNLDKALRHVAGLTEILGQSQIWATRPYGPVEGGDFLNAVQHVRWHGELVPLQAALKRIEVALGRQPNSTWKARPLDLDVLAVRENGRKSWVLLDDDLAAKAFLLQAVAEVAPSLHVGKSMVSELAKRIEPDIAQVTQLGPR